MYSRAPTNDTMNTNAPAHTFPGTNVFCGCGAGSPAAETFNELHLLRRRYCESDARQLGVLISANGSQVLRGLRDARTAKNYLRR